MSKIHPEWLSILPLEDISGDIRARITYTDGDTATTQVISSYDFKEGQVRHIDISFATTDFDAIEPAKTIYSIKFDFYDGDPDEDFILCLPYTPRVENATLKIFYYLNSYGGRDTLIGKGDVQESILTEHLLTRRTLVTYNTNQVDHNYKLEQGTAKREIIFETGPFPRKEIKALRCLQLQKTVWQYFPITDAFVPVIIEGNVLDYPTERESIWRAKFKYRYTFDERAFGQIT